MAAGRKQQQQSQQQQQQQQGVVVAAAEPSVARRMWRVLRAVLYMLRRGVPAGRKLATDLHLLLRRGKVAGKALGDLLLLTFHNGHHRDSSSSTTYPAGAGAGSSSSFSCRALDPGLAVHEPSRACRREVEFSCSTTPYNGAGLGLLGAGKRSRRGRRRRDYDEGYLHCYTYDAADVARVFEMLNADGLFGGGDDDAAAALATPTTEAYATPSPARLLWAFARSPAVARQLRGVADSPAPSVGSSSRDGADDGGGCAQVDRQADEFIRRFYEQLRAQRSAASTPDCYGYNAAAANSPYVSSRRTPQAIAAGTA